MQGLGIKTRDLRRETQDETGQDGDTRREDKTRHKTKTQGIGKKISSYHDDRGKDGKTRRAKTGWDKTE